MVVNNNIKLVGFRNENVHEMLSKNEALKILYHGSNALEEIIKYIHFNPKYPQFQNIIIKNKRTNEVFVYDEEACKYILDDTEEILDSLIIDRFDNLKGFYEEYKMCIKPHIIVALDNLFIAIDSDGFHESKYNDLCVLIYNHSNKDNMKHKHILQPLEIIL